MRVSTFLFKYRGKCCSTLWHNPGCPTAYFYVCRNWGTQWFWSGHITLLSLMFPSMFVHKSGFCVAEITRKPDNMLFAMAFWCHVHSPLVLDCTITHVIIIPFCLTHVPYLNTDAIPDIISFVHNKPEIRIVNGLSIHSYSCNAYLPCCSVACLKDW